MTVSETVLVSSASGEPLVGAMVRVCNADDADCMQPVAELESDDTGKVKIELSSDFAGYLHTKEQGFVPQINAILPPLTGRAVPLEIILLPDSAMSTLADAVGASLESDKGHLLLQTYSCTGSGTGLSLAVPEAGEGSDLFYFEDGLPSTDRSDTSTDGVAGVLNVLPGNVAFVAAARENEVISSQVNVQAGTLTVLSLSPLAESNQEGGT